VNGDPDSGELTIREISARSGVSEGTLRMWEARYEFPRPRRLPSGHRRYSERDLEQIRAVVRGREQGLSLPSAIEHAAVLAREARPSVFAALHESFPQLQAHSLPKPAVVALARAIEDESCARAQRAVLFGCFQQERFYRQVQSRWRDLARTAEAAIVLADFERNLPAGSGPAEVAIAPTDPLMREWVVVCDAPAFSACLVGWERPQGEERHRNFECLWSMEPQVVRMAARVCCELVARTAPEFVGDLHDRLEAPASSIGIDPRSVADLTTRMVLYASQAQL